MNARINRIYWETLEYLIEDIEDKIAEIESYQDISAYDEDKLTGLSALLGSLQDIGVTQK